VVVNKVDKPGANPDKVVNAAFDLFDKLGATDEQLDFPVVYASGINGWSSLEEGPPNEQWGPDMSALFNTILKHVPAQKGDPQPRCSCRSPHWTSPPSSAASAWAVSARAPSSP
jgi:GTP-binding protein